ncbi:MAG TPA: ribonuclease HII [Euryarchaeota archaeon]|nr:MAG: ribonuclease HII [Thermococci archaeon]HDI10398.1 ribonuclease HII [Euryarchaeota archaeon]
MAVAGIDEAGRGPVIGPLIVSGVSFEAEKLSELVRMGVKDSKKLSNKRREELFHEIVRVCTDYLVIKVEPWEIDRVIGRGLKLNKFEARLFSEIINNLKPKQVIIDLVDVNERRFRREVEKYLVYVPENILMEHKADEKYPIVSAASVIAKVIREREMDKIRREYGDIGSGYPSDPKTIEFLRRWYSERGEFPPIVRRSWKTLKRIRGLELGGGFSLFGRDLQQDRS